MHDARCTMHDAHLTLPYLPKDVAVARYEYPEDREGTVIKSQDVRMMRNPVHLLCNGNNNRGRRGRSGEGAGAGAGAGARCQVNWC